eukprot:TRINITY_DN9718_c0_g1_i4.p1 TRINITY_DN9718_c0_g1~~TRINITY_DN9718_c0_g1_i4.p1  ORF type:complete len:104 (+),score=32.23 TRINITY_DN9718_c0_g1_i4:147-458(+)
MCIRDRNRDGSITSSELQKALTGKRKEELRALLWAKHNLAWKDLQQAVCAASGGQWSGTVHGGGTRTKARAPVSFPEFLMAVKQAKKRSTERETAATSNYMMM